MTSGAQAEPLEGVGGGDGIVITGAGLVTCLGLDAASTWAGVLRRACGFRPLTAVESTLPSERTGGQVADLPDHVDAVSAREVSYLRMALREALQQAGLLGQIPYPPPRCGLILGTTLHGMRRAGQFLRSGDADVLRGFLAGSVLQQAADGLPLGGPALTVCSACSSGLASIAWALTLLQAGVIDMAVAGGYDPISEYAYGGFASMRLIAPGPVRPFSPDRDGMRIGEGYGVVVLERAAGAEARGGRPLAVLAGIGASCDAHHLSKPHPEGAGAAAAMSAALTRAGIGSSVIDMIAAHATGTPDNDAAELAALSQVFGERLPMIPVVSYKSHLGHTLGGAGAVELILSLMALREQATPPCAHDSDEAPVLPGVRLSRGDARRGRIRHTLNTSLGFGGANTCAVLSEPGAALASRSADRHRGAASEVLVTGIGVVLPGVVGLDAFRAHLSGPSGRDTVQRLAGPIQGDTLDALLSARRLRRISDYVKLTLAAATLALHDAGVEDTAGFGESCCAVLGTTHGSTAYSERYYRQIVQEGIDAANPLLFAEGVPNAAAAHLSTTFSIKGFCQTVIGTRTAGLEALMLASARVRSGEWQRAIVSAADEHTPLVDDVYRHFGLHADTAGRSNPRPTGMSRPRPGFVTGSGAVALVVESAASAAARGARPRGSIDAFAATRCQALASRQGIESARRLWTNLDRPTQVYHAANGTWLDRVIERALATRHAQRHTVVTTLREYLPECFSALPLAAVACALLRDTAVPASVMAIDYTGVVVGARVSAAASHAG